MFNGSCVCDMSARGVWQTTREELAKLCAAGLPEEIRPHVWRLLLAIVPAAPEGRDGVAEARLEQYLSFLDDTGVPRDDKDEQLSAEAQLAQAGVDVSTAASVPPDTTPLRPYADKETILQISNDLDRCAGGRLHFFMVPHHRAAMRRILLLCARLNGGLGYVQGMTEILAPLYHVFSREAERASRSSGAESSGDQLPEGGPSMPEAWAFFALTSLLSDCRDLYMRDMDAGGGGGVRVTLDRLDAMLRRREPAVAAHLASLHLPSILWAFRWLSTLLVYEFELPDLITLWDCILADPRRAHLHALLATAVAMIRLVRLELLAADFATAMKLLQNYPACDLLQLQRAVANVRREEDEDERTRTSAAPPARATPLHSRVSVSALPKSPDVSSSAIRTSGRAENDATGAAVALSPPVNATAASMFNAAFSGLRRRVAALRVGGGSATVTPTSPLGDVELQER